MDIDLYVAELRLAEVREQAARHRRIQASRAPRRRLRARLGHALLRLGAQLLADHDITGEPAGTTRGAGAGVLTRAEAGAPHGR